MKELEDTKKNNLQYKKVDIPMWVLDEVYEFLWVSMSIHGYMLKYKKLKNNETKSNLVLQLIY